MKNNITPIQREKLTKALSTFIEAIRDYFVTTLSKQFGENNWVDRYVNSLPPANQMAWQKERDKGRIARDLIDYADLSSIIYQYRGLFRVDFQTRTDEWVKNFRILTKIRNKIYHFDDSFSIELYNLFWILAREFAKTTKNTKLYNEIVEFETIITISHLLDISYTQLNWVESGNLIIQEAKEIRLEKGFYVGCYPVTQELYKRITNETPSYFKGKHRPVEQISWNDTQVFIQKLNEQVKLDDGYEFRLPPQLYWEYASRSNQNFKYSGSQKFHEVAWFLDNSNNETMPVGLKEANAFGLYDMNGNIWEWAIGMKCYGGSYLDYGVNIKVDENQAHHTNTYNRNIGFRLFRY